MRLLELLRLIPLKRWLDIATLIAFAGLVIWLGIHERGVGAAKVEAIRAVEHAQAAAVAASAVIANQAETARRVQSQSETSRETSRLNVVSGLAARAAADSADRLRDRLAAAARGASAADTAAPGGCEATSAALAVQSELLGRAVSTARLLAAYADAAAIAGRACVADYDALATP
jgi:hypothetical protein